ncbi:Clp protease N-terminal domain-containing protein [Glycomyces paridis]|uniref:Clp protease n=1 Tax=Glycomyces paridis TaxID=2126555 RepID=A0A4S8PKI2_9ACTN|nr:Clp protease N-terminal domain-containing protein [Glycomyces paridis]THV31257.1 Clp protease [Glycomyces paridis]
MFERFSPASRAAVTGAVGDARDRGDRRVGTEHLLLAVLREGEAEVLLGATAAQAREAAADLDRRALTAVGVDTAGFTQKGPAAKRKSPAFGSGAKAALSRSLAIAVAAKDKRIEPRHLLLALLERDRPDPVAELFAALGIDPTEARARFLPR